MKIEFKMTKTLKEVSLDDDGIVPWVSMCVIPITATFLLFPFMGPVALMIGIVSWFFQIMLASLMNANNIPEEFAFFFMWIPVILLAPITIPLDIVSSISKGVWGWFSKRKTEKKIRSSWKYLLEKGLDPHKIEIDSIGNTDNNQAKTAKKLFEEIITDQLERSLIKKSNSNVFEEVKVIRHERNGDKICLIGSFVLSENILRKDGSKNSSIKGRVFGMTFSISEYTGVCKVVHHISRDLREVHEDEQLEDLWFDLTNASDFSSQTAKDPWERRVTKCFGSKSKGATIFPEETSRDQTSDATELE